MNRPVALAAFALLAVSIPVYAQHGGGGHAGGGGFGGHAGGFSGHSSFSGGGAVHSFSGGTGRSYSHSYSGARAGSGFTGHSYGVHSFSGPLARGRSGVGVRIRSYGYPYGRYWGYGGWGWGYPYLYGGIDPYWWWDNDSNSGDDQNYAGDPGLYGYDNGLANQMQEQGVPMRPAPDAGDYYSRSAPPRPAQHQQTEETQAVPPTVLVFRDQHQEQVQNYAIVGDVLWNFTPTHTRKIPLSDLDLDATKKANEDHGVDFRLPSGSEGQ